MNNYSFDLKAFKTPEKAAFELAEEILHFSQKTIEAKGNCVWAVSGGSSIMVFYDALKKLSEPKSEFWNHLSVCWVDERHVPHDHEDSNFGSAFHYFWEVVEGPVLIPVPYFNDHELSAKQYQKKISDYGIGLVLNIDVLILGMGTDGHTASLFPNGNKKGEWDSDTNVLSAEHKGMKRISLNYPLLNSSGIIRFLAFSAEKGVTFKNANRENNRDKYPFLGINRARSLFYVDRAFYEEAR